jgi:O-antigen ligase
MKVLQTKTSIKFAILGFLGGACVSTVITLKANALFLFNPDFRVGGTVGHPVFLGILFAFAMIFSLSSSLHEISGWKLFRFVLLPFFAFIVIKTQSGTALLVLGVGILCWIIQIFLSESKISTKILLLVLSAFGLSSLKIYLETLQIYQRFFFNLTSTRTSDLIASSSDSTLAIRWQTIKFGWDKIKQAPILGNGLDLSGQFNLSGMQPHSIFLLAWQTGGLLLFFGSLFFFFDGIVRLVTSLSNKMIVPLTVIMGTWMSFFSNPFFYDVSFISPYYLGIFMIRCNKKENINYC